MKRYTLLYLIILFSVSHVWAGNTGKIIGKITDANTKEVLVGANVLIVGTSYGGVSDVNGDFLIINIPAGTYDLRISFLSYGSVLIKSVKVIPDFTTEANAELTSEAIQMTEVTVVAERKLIQKDATTTVSILDAQQIQALPVVNFTQTLVLVPGFVNSDNGSGDDGVHLRGGRSGELSYIIDGVRVDDPIYGGLAMDLPRNGVASLTVMSGTFNAEYGQAQAGVVNITTPEGSVKYSGMVRGATDNFGVKSNDWDTYRGEFSVSGPVPVPMVEPDAVTFFVGGDRTLTRTYLNTAKGPTYLSPGGRTIQNEFSFGLFDRRSRLNGKITFRPMSEIKIHVGSAYSLRSWRDYDHYFKYSPDYNDQQRMTSVMHTFSMTHMITPATFYEIKFSYFQKRYDSFLYEEDMEGNDISKRFKKIFYPVTIGNAFDSTSNYEFAGPYAVGLHLEDVIAMGYRTLGGNLVKNGVLYGRKGDILTDDLIIRAGLTSMDTISVMVPSTDNYFENNNSISRTLTANFTSQVDKQNMIKLGFEYKWHNLDNFWISGINSYWDHLNPNMPVEKRHEQMTYYRFRPIQLSAYVQDKIEFSDIILNIGLRFDYLDSKAPDVYSYIGNPKADTSWATTSKVKPKMHISPRIGFAHPITDRIKFRFSYGQFYQYPDFNFLYRRFNMLVSDPSPNLAQGYEPSIGNPNLKPEVTHAYEFGGEFEMAEDLVGSLTLFYKDTYDYISTKRIDRNPYAYTQIVNMDYANSRGIEVTIRKRLTSRFSFQANYTYSRSEGNADYWSTHADEAYLESVYGIVAPKRTLTLAWDQPHTLNFSANIDFASWGTSVIGQFGSGLPYSPTDARGKPIGDRNTGRMPWTGTIDMRAFKKFAIEPVDVILYGDVTNLLNKKNILDVFSATGRPDYTTNPNASPENQHRPQWYGASRHVELGLEVGF